MAICDHCRWDGNLDGKLIRCKVHKAAWLAERERTVEAIEKKIRKMPGYVNSLLVSRAKVLELFK